MDHISYTSSPGTVVAASPDNGHQKPSSIASALPSAVTTYRGPGSRQVTGYVLRIVAEQNTGVESLDAMVNMISNRSLTPSVMYLIAAQLPDSNGQIDKAALQKAEDDFKDQYDLQASARTPETPNFPSAEVAVKAIAHATTEWLQRARSNTENAMDLQEANQALAAFYKEQKELSSVSR